MYFKEKFNATIQRHPVIIEIKGCSVLHNVCVCVFSFSSCFTFCFSIFFFGVVFFFVFFCLLCSFKSL